MRNEFTEAMANVLFAGLTKIDQLTDEQLDHLLPKPNNGNSYTVKDDSGNDIEFGIYIPKEQA